MLLQLIEFWCNGCIKALCRECVVLEHRNHSIVRTHESAQEFKQIMPTIVNDLKCKTESINNVITQVCSTCIFSGLVSRLCTPCLWARAIRLLATLRLLVWVCRSARLHASLCISPQLLWSLNFLLRPPLLLQCPICGMIQVSVSAKSIYETGPAWLTRVNMLRDCPE
mgnify:CR=1 FL=1